MARRPSGTVARTEPERMEWSRDNRTLPSRTEERHDMRGKRLMILGLSAMLALTTLAFTAPAASAHDDHPNIMAQVDKWIHKAEGWSGTFIAARYMYKIPKGGRHWAREHGYGSVEDAKVGNKGSGKYPRFILRMGCASPEFDAWWVASRKVSKTGFRHYRGLAAKYRWLDPVDRESRAFFNALLFRGANRQYDDALEDLVDCILDESRGPSWLKRLLF